MLENADREIIPTPREVIFKLEEVYLNVCNFLFKESLVKVIKHANFNLKLYV